jgi:hypothetical protein
MEVAFFNRIGSRLMSEQFEDGFFFFLTCEKRLTIAARDERVQLWKTTNPRINAYWTEQSSVGVIPRSSEWGHVLR